GYVEQRLRDDPRLAWRVRRLGHRSDVAGLLKGSDVLVLPSRWGGMPNVILEAMAARRGVIRADGDGAPGAPFGGGRGAPGDINRLSEAIMVAASDRHHTQRLGEEGRSNVELYHTQSATVARYDSMWRRVLGFPEVPISEARE